MLGVFREVAIAIATRPVGQLATFDLMFEGIRTSLKAAIQSAIQVAEESGRQICRAPAQGTVPRQVRQRSLRQPCATSVY